MEYKVEITSLSHDDLVNILSTATYGNNFLDINVPTQYRELAHQNPAWSWEDGLANVLLNGGELEITDCQSEEPNEGWEAYGHNYQSVRWEEFECAPWHQPEQGKWGNIIYTVKLENFLKGCQSEKGYKLANELLINEDGDMWTAYNLIQMILFEEEIYG